MYYCLFFLSGTTQGCDSAWLFLIALSTTLLELQLFRCEAHCTGLLLRLSERFRIQRDVNAFLAVEHKTCSTWPSIMNKC